jgi:hypothetical protein
LVYRTFPYPEVIQRGSGVLVAAQLGFSLLNKHILYGL